MLGSPLETVTPSNDPARIRLRHRLEYVGVWCILKFLGLLPRWLSRLLGRGIGFLVYLFHARLRRVGMFNLALVFPDLPKRRRQRLLRETFRHLGWLLAEFSQFPKYNRKNIERVVIYDGFENFREAARQGRGVLFLTAHFGPWELSSYAQSLYGYPVHFLVRPIDNPLVDQLVNRYRCRTGNVPIDKSESARAVLETIRDGGTIGILIDQNTTPEGGVFVEFFGIPACTTTGLARLALKTRAPVVPGFIFWDTTLKKYRLRFDPPVVLAETGDTDRDLLENTARFIRIIEEHVRCHPEQWLWVHRRWKSRPPGEKSLYPF